MIAREFGLAPPTTPDGGIMWRAAAGVLWSLLRDIGAVYGPYGAVGATFATMAALARPRSRDPGSIFTLASDFQTEPRS